MQYSKQMFPIVHNVNQLAASINSLKIEINKIRLDIDRLNSSSSERPHSQASPDTSGLSSIKADIQKVTSDSSQHNAEMKRYVDAIKQDVTREIGMLETTILRKCEVTMHRMITDKISVALDKEKGHLQDKVVDEVARAMSEMHTNDASPCVDTPSIDVGDDDFAITVKPPTTRKRAAPARSKKLG
jgi:predicted transcriptional regulator